MPEEAPVNTGAPWPVLSQARERVLGMQAKLHQWAAADGNRRFDDLYNLVCDPAFLRLAWERVATNAGGRSAGVDGQAARDIEAAGQRMELLDEVRAQLKARTYRPVPARERMIPKPGGKKRRLGIPTIADRLVQASLKLVLEPIFEAGFDPCSYGFRPNRRAQDAIAEIHHLGTLKYHWVLEADIEACFDSIDHSALMQRLRQRIGDKRVLALVKAFLKAGVLSEHGQRSNTLTGTPQGGILSPLLANIALSALDEHFTGHWQQMMATPTQRQRRRRHGQANWRLIRYADDFVVMVHGPRGAAEGLRDQVAAVLAPFGLRLAEAKTQVVHIDEGFDFLGFRIQRYRKKGSHKRYVYTFPARRAVDSVKQKVKALTRRTSSGTLREVLGRINAILRGWTNYFKHGVSKRVFSYLKSYTERRLARLLRTRHRRLRWKDINRRYVNNQGVIVAEGMVMFNPAAVPVTRYRYRGAKIPTPWASAATAA